MKYILVLITLFLNINIIFCQNISIKNIKRNLKSSDELLKLDTNQKRAIIIFDSNLTKIKYYVFGLRKYRDNEEISVEFLYNITGIESESDHSYIGSSWPTVNDYRKWSIWFLDNYDRLYWDEKSKMVKVKEKELKKEK